MFLAVSGNLRAMPAAPDPGDDEREDLARLGTAVRRSREMLGLTIELIAKAANVSPVTWGRVEKGLAVRGLTYASVERALAWPAGRAQDILSNIPERPETPDNVGPDDDPLIAEIWGDPALTEDQKMQLEQIVRRANADRALVEERLRRSGRRAG